MAKPASKSKKDTKQYTFTRRPIFNIHHSADPLFAAKCHPSEPVFVTGTATGHVQAYKYDIAKLEEIYEDQDKFPYDVSCVKYDDFDDDSIVVHWHTKRHKKSCRDLCFDLPSGGDKIYTLGSEGVIKAADLKTGQVVSKFSCDKDNSYDFQIGTFTKCISPPGKNFLVVGDEEGNLMCHDTRGKHLQLVYKPFRKLHSGEGINSINYCWPKSEYKFITTGSTTVCEVDLRKPEEPLHTSEDQEDEVLCSTWLDQAKQETMICGMGDGIVTTWKPEMNRWEDQISRIRIAKNETVESLISAMDSDSRFMYGGCSNGHIAKIDIKGGKVVERFLQNDPEDDDKVDEVLGLDLDHNYRLVSFGTDGFKIWEEESKNGGFDDGEDDDGDEISSNSDSDGGYGSDASDSGEEEGKNAVGIKLPAKRSLADSLKRRLDGTTNATSKKSRTEPPLEPEEQDEAEIGVEVEDSDEEEEDSDSVNQGKTIELHEVREQILARISNPELHDSDDAKPGKKASKDKKKGKGAAPQEHGIRKFDDL